MTSWDWQVDDGWDRAERANDRDDRDQAERAWEQERQDALTRDAGEKPGWPIHSERIRDAGYELGDPKGASVR
jgi:hypothetical protein